MSTSGKVSLMEMAEAVGDAVFSARGHLERWDRDHPNDPLPPNNQWVVRARTYEAAQLTLSLMALDEEASRKFVTAIIASKTEEAKLLMAMLQAPSPASAAANTNLPDMEIAS